MEIGEMYVSGMMSIPQISEATGIPLSTIYFRLKRIGVLRSRGDSVRLAANQGRMSQGKGKTRVFTKEWKENIATAQKKRAERTAKGTSIKPSGYVEITRGENKFRGQHVVVVEEIIGRRLFANECVHHKDGNRQNNAPENLQLMTRSEHARLHALERYEKRERDQNGRFR